MRLFQCGNSLVSKALDFSRISLLDWLGNLCSSNVVIASEWYPFPTTFRLYFVIIVPITIDGLRIERFSDNFHAIVWCGNCSIRFSM